ncbi:hypothetical protein [Halobacteriovorax sp.]|uniref:hypothetical protein n=1 Tax=Halobacteriovorax sp. TaxID=2020862 RepID=UPI0035627FDC
MLKSLFKIITQLVLVLVIPFISLAQPVKETLFVNKISLSKESIVKDEEIRRHLVDIIIDTNKYDLSLNSREQKKGALGKKKYKESLLDVELIKAGKEYTLKTRLNERNETLKLPSKAKKRDLLIEIRMQLYKVILDKGDFVAKEAQLRSTSTARVDREISTRIAKEKLRKRKIAKRKAKARAKAIYLEKRKRKLQRKSIAKTVKPTKRKILTQKPESPQKRIVKKKRVRRKVRRKRPIRVAEKSKKKSFLEGQEEEKKSKDKGFTWPKLYFSVGMIFGQQVMDLMPESQGKPLVEFGAGIHLIQYGMKFYGTMSSLSEFDGVEKQATQSNVNFFITKDLKAINTLPWGLVNLLDNSKAPGQLGVLVGFGQSSFAGKIVPRSDPVSGVALGGYFTALGIMNIEARYFKAISEPSSSVSSSGDFSSFILKLTVGYPI